MSELSELENLLGISNLTAAQLDWVLENEHIAALEYDADLKNRPLNLGGRSIQNWSTARKGYLGILNRYAQLQRQGKFWERVNRGEDQGKIRVVSEGDSWFNYPFLMKDIIDQLFDDFSILSLGYGGDWLSNIYQESEYIEAIKQYDPHIFLISGGGNDMVGSYRMLDMLHSYKHGASATDLIKLDRFQELLNDFELIYRSIFDEVLALKPTLQIICHGYDYPWFGGREKHWFGIPFKKKGIRSESLRNEIGGYLIDQFNSMLHRVANDYPSNVHFLNNKGLVPRHLWKDELHPKQEGFGLLAAVFRDKMREVV